MRAQLKNVIDPDEDAIVIYEFNGSADFEKMGIGQVLRNEDFIL